MIPEASSELRWQLDEIEWLQRLFASWTTHVEEFTPSAWAEQRRYLPASNTSLPGPYRFSVTPYLREIADCLSVDSPIRFIALQKGAQIGGTVGILENAVGYLIDHVKTAPVMFVTADAELAKQRLDTNVLPMIQASRLEHLIKSGDDGNKRKTGKTAKKIEWAGGGYLLPFGAKNANKLRSMSIQYLLNDEIDAWALRVGKDGDPLKLAIARTQAYEQTRKVFSLSTPLYKGQSRINELFLDGDQRYYYVSCIKCGMAQVLRWRNGTRGAPGGITWEMDGGRLVPGTVRYLCANPKCAHPHTNDDKVRLLAPENGAEWRPTATPINPQTRSYHLSALYSPPGMHSWEAIVELWLECWDEERGRAKNLDKLQTFYNNELGEPFELRTKRLTYEHVSPHRRKGVYTYGQIPNKWARQHCGGRVQLLNCAVDVHADCLKVGVFGWCADRRSILVDYLTFQGDTSHEDDEATWGELEKLIDSKEYVADDGARYAIATTLIDSGDGQSTDVVYTFCQRFSSGVFPIKGRALPPKNASIKHFSEFVSKETGVTAYGITVDLYKDRISAALLREWDGQSLQPPGHFNAPGDATDKQLRELTNETKREKIDPVTRQRVGWEWHRPSGGANELWDLLVYASAGLDMLAWDYFGRGEDDDIDRIDFKRFFEELDETEHFINH